VLHLSIGTSFISEETQTACDSYFWRNKLFYETGIYSDESPNPDGCDSTFYLNLTVNHSETFHIAEKACREYEWYGTIYNESGDYEYVEQNVFGCDSTVILHLSIDEGLSTGIHGQSVINPATNLIMGVYTYYVDSTNIDPANVHWSLDLPEWRITPHRASCRVMCLSEGEAKLRAWTENEFCDFDTTLLLIGKFFDVDENDEVALSVYPNPTRGQVTVSWHDIEEVHVIDMLGQRLASYQFGKVESCEINIRDYAHGVYMLEIISSAGKAYRPVVRGLY
jgi:hypothetical protein